MTIVCNGISPIKTFRGNMSQCKFWIFFFVFKLILVKTKQQSDERFLSGMQLLYPKDEHLCGGVLISIQHVLTAASCVEGFEEGWDLSQLKLSSGDASEIREASTFNIHSNYKHETLENNLAIIKANKPFDLNSDVNPVKIADQNTTKDCYVVTWSIKEKFITKVSSQSAMQVFEQPMDKCSMNISKTICMGGKNVTVCEEDYGCPLVCEGFLAGIFIGPGHACDGLPGVYVNVTGYEAWLKKTTENFAAHFSQFKPPSAYAAADLIALNFKLFCIVSSIFGLMI